jgi:hypothetical protein
MTFQLLSEENNNFNKKFVYFKLVGIGDVTICEEKEKISEKLNSAKAFCLIYDSEDELRANMHKFVDNFCDKIKGS